MSSLKVVSYGANVLTLEDVKRYLRMEETTDHDARLSDLIPVAETIIEDRTGRAIRQNAYQYSVGYLGWSGLVRLPRPPFIEVSQVTTYSANGTPIDVPFAVIPYGEFGAVVVDPSAVPGMQSGAPFSIEYTAGYAAPDAPVLPRVTASAALPPSLLQAMRLLVGHYFEHTEAALDSGNGGGNATILPEGVEQLVLPYIVLALSG